MKSSLALVSCFSFLSLVSCIGLREEFTWTRINFEGKPSDSSYIYQNNVPMGVNVWKNKLFITIPRRRLGVPSTLNYVFIDTNKSHRNVPLRPYPDWKTNSLNASGTKFVSVYRVEVDPFDRLWFVDTGLIETPGNPQQVQPNALVVMDLNTDKIIRRHVFDEGSIREFSNLAALTIDVPDNNPEDAFAYVPDLTGYGLFVYSFKEDKSWRVSHNYFYLEPTAGDFSVGGVDFQWNDGIFSIVLSKEKSDGYKDAYFHSLAGLNIYRVSTRILKNETLATRSYHGKDFEIVGRRQAGQQATSTALDASSGILFLNLLNQNAVACWNVNTPLSKLSIVHKDDQKMLYPSDIKIRDKNLIVMSNTSPVFLYRTLDYDVVNFRVWVQGLDTAILKTNCTSQS